MKSENFFFLMSGLKTGFAGRCLFGGHKRKQRSMKRRIGRLLYVLVTARRKERSKSVAARMTTTTCLARKAKPLKSTSLKQKQPSLLGRQKLKNEERRFFFYVQLTFTLFFFLGRFSCTDSVLVACPVLPMAGDFAFLFSWGGQCMIGFFVAFFLNFFLLYILQ